MTMRHLQGIMAGVALFAWANAAPAQEEHMLVCHRTATPPVMDGDLADAAWSQGEPTTSFYQYGSSDAAAFETVAVLLHDEQRLYLGVLMRKNPGEALSKGSMWGGDAVELFLDPGRTRSRYFQVAANHKETFMAACETGKGGNAGWQGGLVAAAKEVPGGWSLEMSLPFAPMGATPKPGEIWGANLCRDDSVHGLSTFACLRGGFHQPAAFAELRFSDGPATTGEKGAEAERRAANLEEKYRMLMVEMQTLSTTLRPKNPGHELLLRKLEECQNLMPTVAPPASGGGLFMAKRKGWILASLLDDLADNLAWQMKTAQLFD